jgi:hypothetical protein
MSQYVRYNRSTRPRGLGALGAEEDPCATAESLIQALPAKWKAIKTKIESWSPTDQTKTASMQALAKDMDTWRVNYLDLAKTYAPTLASKLLGGSWFWASECEAIVIQLRTFEKQLITMDKQYTVISGLPGVPGADKPSGGVKPSGPWERTKDLAWDLLKIGTIGLGVWYGGKLLYQYLDEKTRYPAARLPRYAGGKRR